jgi:hypothetical protein
MVSDSPARLARLKAALKVGQHEISGVTSPAELRHACRGGHELAVIDVGPAHLVEVLQALRTSPEYAEISVLVAASRHLLETHLAGALLQYRAMPCSQSELARLVHRRITSTTGRRRTKRLL